jgi:hypothetical protein
MADREVLNIGVELMTVDDVVHKLSAELVGPATTSPIRG